MENKYLLEIGVEEIPARYVDNTLLQMKNNTIKMLKEQRLTYSDIKLYSTPRRLVLIIEGFPCRQDDIKKVVKGPSKKIAFDKEGNPTKALLGFANSQSLQKDDMFIREYNGDEYVYANKVIEGESTENIFQREMPSIIRSISFPKSMKWGGKNLRFARPIRWIVSLLNDKVIKFDLEGITVSNITRGHRFLGKSEIQINNVSEYFPKMKENYVIVDQKERKDIIKYSCEKLAKEKGGNLLKDEALLDEITNIVEYPTALIGRIKDDYLSLPKEVIITPMKEHQRYFPVLDDKKRLLPYFITVRNGNEEYIDMVRKGNEKVLDARLEDAKFFYFEDTKKPLEDYVDSLKGIVFQEKLGTLYDKTIRVTKLASKIGEYLEVGEETKKNIQRAGYLSKADLVTNMVGEFTELQGVMGREYALKSGENEITSLAIYEQYLPRFSGDDFPTTTAGAILSIADKLDTIAGCFAIGIQPTGSQDPYGLRRQALGIIYIILDKKWNLSLGELIDFALYIYVEENGLAFDYKKVKADILEFFQGRIRNMLIDVEKIRYDIVDAVLNSGIDDVYDLLQRANKLNSWLEKEGLNEILLAFNRVANIAAGSEKHEVKRELFEEEEENKLYDKFNVVEEKVDYYLQKKEYDKALDQLVTLREPIDNFFDKVMVMVDDEDIRNNRLAVLQKIYNMMISICDLSKIVNK